MSALLAHIKSHRAIAAGFMDVSLGARGDNRAMLTAMSRAHEKAAEILEKKAVEECGEDERKSE